jgi:hypothetical protein
MTQVVKLRSISISDLMKIWGKNIIHIQNLKGLKLKMLDDYFLNYKKVII